MGFSSKIEGNKNQDLFFRSEVKTSTVSSNGRDVQDDIEKKLSDLYPNFGIDLNIIENSDENGMKFAFNIRKVSVYVIVVLSKILCSKNAL